MLDVPSNPASARRKSVTEVFYHNLARHYFDRKGRVGRREFWYFILACSVIYAAVFPIEFVIGRRVLTPVIGLMVLLPIAGLGARRLQDIGKNGLFIAAYSIPTATLEVISLLEEYGVCESSGTLKMARETSAFIWLIAALTFAYLWS